MNKRQYRYIYGPVPSWRLGSSLGVDPISRGRKVCTLDCVYCQLGPARPLLGERKVFIPTAKIMDELASLPPVSVEYITFSGTGEPTLAANLGEMIRSVRERRPEKIAVLTNSSLIHRDDVTADLSLADLVVAKLDAVSQDVFERVNRPVQGTAVDTVISAIKEFRKRYTGRLALQIMLIKENRTCAGDIATAAKEIAPDEVQLNTPLRPCGVKPLDREEMAALEELFSPLRTVSVYKAEKRPMKPISSEDTLKRRGKV